MNELPQGWTIEDVQFLLDKLESGCAILVADRNLGIGTIHDFPNAEHCGFGCFRVFADDGFTVIASFDGGAAMERTPSGKGWTSLSIKGDSFTYDFDGVKATLQAFLADPAGFEPGKGDAYDYIPDWMDVPPLYTTEKTDHPLAMIRLFSPDSSWVWYILEYDGEDIAFGLVVGHETEMGYFSISELASVTGPLGLRIERDVWFKPTPVTQLAEYQRQWPGGGPYKSGQSFAKQLSEAPAEALLAKVASSVPEMSGFGPTDAGETEPEPTVVPEVEWQPTPEDRAEFTCWELHLLTGPVNNGRKGAFQRALSQITRPGTLRLALTRVNADPRRHEAIEGRLAAFM